MHNCLNIQWSDVDGASLRPEDFITINMAGKKYETLRTTLERFPHTLLGSESTRQYYYIQSRNAYYFDKNIECFEAILYYYQSGGILTRPTNVPMDVFEEVVQFFQLGEEVFKNLCREEGLIIDEENDDDVSSAQSTFQRNVWKLFEDPTSSKIATVVSSISILVICISIINFCLETLPAFKNQVHDKHKNATKIKQDDDQNFQQARIEPCFSLELSCISWFTFEYVVRFLSSPSKFRFMTSFLNMVDFLAIVPYFVTLGINSRGIDSTPLSVLRVVRLVRVFRILKLTRHSDSLKVLGDTLHASVHELIMLIFSLCIGVFAFSCAVYYAELGNNDMFKSIPDVFYYSLVTMTTVGYGDKVPTTPLGKLIGSACALTGVLMLALSVPVIVSNFEFFYKRGKMISSRRKKTYV